MISKVMILHCPAESRFNLHAVAQMKLDIKHTDLKQLVERWTCDCGYTCRFKIRGNKSFLFMGVDR